MPEKAFGQPWTRTEALRLPSRNGISWVPLPGDWPPALSGGLSARRGGVSRGNLNSLNFGSRVGDSPELIDENLRRLSLAVGVNLLEAARVHLQHGRSVLEVDSPGLAGSADAMVTREPDLPLAATVADCLPLLLAADGRAVGIAHCGWRGILSGVAPAVVKALVRLSGRPAAGLRAWIGPGIGPCCFNVSAEVALRFPPEVRIGWRGWQRESRVDLPRLLRHQLEQAGLGPGRIQEAGLCSACRRDLFYSHRRDRASTGRMLAWIMRGS